jgi:hypothetical protein
MDYEWDLFVSFRREDSWTPWTHDYFKRELIAYLQPELQRRPSIYVDDRSPGDVSSATALGTKLARSRALLAVFSGDYWTSQWCLHELDLMLDRAAGGLEHVIAVIVHDSKDLEPPIGLIESTSLEGFRFTHMDMSGNLYQQFSAAIRNLAPRLCDTIDNSPVIDGAWVASCVERFTTVYAAELRGNVIAPKWFKPPPPRRLRTVPRIAF